MNWRPTEDADADAPLTAYEARRKNICQNFFKPNLVDICIRIGKKMCAAEPPFKHLSDKVVVPAVRGGSFSLDYRNWNWSFGRGS